MSNGNNTVIVTGLIEAGIQALAPLIAAKTAANAEGRDISDDELAALRQGAVDGAADLQAAIDAKS